MIKTKFAQANKKTKISKKKSYVDMKFGTSLKSNQSDTFMT